MVKRDSRTIVFDVSSHGFGHLGQIAPVIIELIAQHPTARVVVRNTHAASVVNNILGFHVAKFLRKRYGPAGRRVQRRIPITDYLK